MTFLLKPNHAVGLVLLPWVLRAFAGITGWRSRIAAGLLLHLMGWAFVIHMGATCIGLVVFALLGLAARRPDARRDAMDVAAVIGINLLVVSPYLVLLLLGHGVFQGNPRHQIPPWSPHLLEATARLGWMLPLAVWGGVVAWRRDRLGRAWAAQAVGALVLWLAFYPLSALEQAKERDDVFYWLRFLAAAMAAIGAWDLARRGARQLTGRAAAWLGAPHRRRRRAGRPRAAVGAALLVGPGTDGPLLPGIARAVARVGHRARRGAGRRARRRDRRRSGRGALDRRPHRPQGHPGPRLSHWRRTSARAHAPERDAAARRPGRSGGGRALSGSRTSW